MKKDVNQAAAELIQSFKDGLADNEGKIAAHQNQAVLIQGAIQGVELLLQKLAEEKPEADALAGKVEKKAKK